MKKKLTAAALSLALVVASAGTALAAPGNGNGKNKQSASTTPDIVALAGPLADQRIDWQPCDFGDEELNAEYADAECGTVEVPRDWHDPSDEATFEVAVSRVQTVDPASPAYRGTITANPGGPGGPGLIWGPAMSTYLPELRGSYNFLGFDPRGVGQSTHGVCEVPTEEFLNAETEYETYELIANCQDNPDVRAINTEQTVYDMDLLRHLAGAPKLSYVGYSYGTWLGAWYGAVFGANAEKFVLDSNAGITDSTLERTFAIQAYARDRQFREHLMNWTARHDDTFALGTVPSEVYADYLHAAEVLDGEVLMLIWLLTGGYIAFPVNTEYPTGAFTVKTVIEVARLVEERGMDPWDALIAVLDDVLGDVDGGEEQLPELPEFPEEPEELPAVTEIDEPFYWIMCQDGQFDQDLAAQERRAAQRTADNPLSAALGTTGVSPCVFFETDLAKPAPGPDFPATLLLQAEHDSQTAWELGVEASRSWPNSRLIAVDNEGSHGLFPYGLSTVDGPVRALFATGQLPKKDVVAQAKPLPWDETTWESWRRLNPTARHAGPEEDNAFQPIKTNGKGHPMLPPEGLPVSELLAETTDGDAAVAAAQELRRLVDLGR